MKILIVNTSDMQGGAARAAYRLHKALLTEGVDSRMLVQNKQSGDHTISGPGNKIGKMVGLVRPFADSLPVMFYKKRDPTLFSPAWLPFSGIVKKINRINPDIVHLHWITGGMIKIEDLNKIRAPVVWTLHDNWAFTGGCHIKWECERYKARCGSCPRLGSHTERDLSRKTWNRKHRAFTGFANMTIVGVSSWLADCAKESSLLKDKNITALPNPLDTGLFKPFDKQQARRLWNLPSGKKLVLFGADRATRDINKGFRELKEALDKLKSNNIELVVFGSSAPEEPADFNFKTHYVGHLYDEISLVTLYSAVDVMVVPSLQEAFGQTAAESLACGTPVAAFGHTGLLDVIDHKVNGYLAQPFDTADLAGGIEWILQNEHAGELSRRAREKAAREFDSKMIARQYLDLYRKITG